MRNVVVLGCGRSGTSMLAGLFARAGYSMGRGLFPPNPGNPKGLFESREVNRINEAILEPWSPRPGLASADASADGSTGVSRGWLARWIPRYRGWLATIPTDVEIARLRADPRIDRRIRRAVAREPYCLKDPRFCYTLDLWRPHLRDPLLVCVFREPERTLRSIVRETQRVRALRELRVDQAVALEIWCAMYRWILERHAHSGRWLFVHADQVLEGRAIGRLEEETGARLDHDFADPALQSGRPTLEPELEMVKGKAVEGIYRELCKRADWEPTREPS